MSGEEKGLVLSNASAGIAKELAEKVNSLLTRLDQVNGRIDLMVQKTGKADKKVMDTLRESNGVAVSIREKAESEILTVQDCLAATTELHRLIGQQSIIYLQLAEENSKYAELATTAVNFIMLEVVQVKKSVESIVRDLLFYETQHRALVTLNDKSRKIHGMDIPDLIAKAPGNTWEHKKIKKAIRRVIKEYIKNHPEHVIYTKNISRLIYDLVKKEHLTLLNSSGSGSYMDIPRSMIDSAVKYVEELSIKEIVRQIILDNSQSPNANINLVSDFEKWLVNQGVATDELAPKYSQYIHRICEDLNIEPVMLSSAKIPDECFKKSPDMSRMGKAVYGKFVQFLAKTQPERRANVVDIKNHEWKRRKDNLVLGFEKWLITKCKISDKSAKDYSRCVCKICVKLNVSPDMLGTVNVPNEIFSNNSDMHNKGKAAYNKFLQYLSENGIEKETPVETVNMADFESWLIKKGKKKNSAKVYSRYIRSICRDKHITIEQLATVKESDMSDSRNKTIYSQFIQYINETQVKKGS